MPVEPFAPPLTPEARVVKLTADYVTLGEPMPNEAVPALIFDVGVHIYGLVIVIYLIIDTLLDIFCPRKGRR